MSIEHTNDIIRRACERMDGRAKLFADRRSYAWGRFAAAVTAATLAHAARLYGVARAR